MGYGKGSVYAELNPTWWSREIISNRPSAQEKKKRYKGSVSTAIFNLQKQSGYYKITYWTISHTKKETYLC